MPSDTATVPTASDVATSSSLATYAQEILREAKANRTRVQKKWVRNYAAANCDDNFDPDTWKEQESKKKKTWKSDSYLDVTRQKITAFMALAVDSVFKGGRVPFMLDADTRTVPPTTDPLIVQAAIDSNQDEIHRQQTATDAITHLKRCLLSGAIYGEYYAKRYVTDAVETVQEEPYPNMLVKTVRRTPTAAIRQVSVWNFWWEREAGSPQRAEYCIEREMIGQTQLRAMAHKPFFMADKIKAVLDKSANRQRQSQTPADTSTLPPGHRTTPYRSRPTEYYEFWLWVPVDKADEFELQNAESLRQANIPPEWAPGAAAAEREQQPPPQGQDNVPDSGAPDTDDSRRVYVYLGFCEGEIIAYCRDPGDNPFFGDQFEETLDSLYGRGIADNIESWQKAVNGAVRSFENNAKLIANFIVAVKRRLLTNKIEDQIDEGGVLELSEECQDIGKAVQQLVFQDITGPLLKWLEVFMEFADLASNIPRAQQGQQVGNPQTAFELAQRLERSGKYVGEIIARFDKLVAWSSQAYYDANSENPDLQIPKIPAVVKALGFTSFENRYIRLQRLLQVLNLVLSDPSGELRGLSKIRWLYEEILKGLDLEPAQAMKSPEEQAQEQAALAAASQTPPDPTAGAKAEALSAQAARSRAAAALDKARGVKVIHDIQAGAPAPGMALPPAGAPAGVTP